MVCLPRRRGISSSGPRKGGSRSQTGSLVHNRPGRVLLLIRTRLVRARVGSGEEVIAGYRKCTDDKNTDQPNHDGDEDRYNLDEGRITDDRVAGCTGVVDNSHRNAPPGEGGIESSCQQPGAKEIPDLSGFIATLLRREDTGDAGEINSAESNGKNSGPSESGEREIAEYIVQGKLGSAIVENLESQKGADNDHAPGSSATETTTAGNITPHGPQSIPYIIMCRSDGIHVYLLKG